MLSGCLGFLNGKTSYVTYYHGHLLVDAWFLAKPENTMGWGWGRWGHWLREQGKWLRRCTWILCLLESEQLSVPNSWATNQQALRLPWGWAVTGSCGNSPKVLEGWSIVSFSLTFPRTLEIGDSECGLDFAQNDMLLSNIGDRYCWAAFSKVKISSFLLHLFPGHLSSKLSHPFYFGSI